MILSRVIRHLKEQHWMAVFIELVIVILGVFIGLQAQDWNQGRVDRRMYEEAVGRLREEIAANLGTLDLADSDVNAERPRVRAALDALETCSDDPAVRKTVDDGVALISGTNGLKLRDQSLSELISAPPLLAQQSASVRRRLADLLFYQRIAESQAAYDENAPQEGRPERIAVLSPGPWTKVRTTYLGIVYDYDIRQLKLNVPVSVACKNHDLVAALWFWDRWQTNLILVVQKMRNEYRLTLAEFDKARVP